MPRGVGVANADTVQQRARFLGYKRQYLGYCRVYLEPEAHAAYAEYVDHEETLRRQLVQHRRTGQPLSEWRRAFFLTPRLGPTRHQVLALDCFRGVLSDDWFYPRSPHWSPQAVESNRHIIDEFLSGLSLQPDSGHPQRTPAQRHRADTQVSLAQLHRELLTRLRFGSLDDSHRLTGLLLQIARYLDDEGDAVCAVYLMGTQEGRHTRGRGLDDRNRILNLFQGAHPSRPRAEQGRIYPGDMAIRAPQGLAVQIHRLTLSLGRGPDRQVVHDDVPTIAVWVPREMAADWLVQEGQDEFE